MKALKPFHCFLLILSLMMTLVARGQNNQKYYTIGQQQFANSISSDNKKNFWDFVAYAGSIMNNSANGFSFNPTLDKLGFKGNGFQDIQFNFIPVTKGTDITKYDSLNIGFKFAIINNYSLSKWKKVITNDANVRRFLLLRNTLILLSRAKDYISTGFTLDDNTRKFSDFESDMIKAFAVKVDSGKISEEDLNYVAPEYKYALFLTLSTNFAGSVPAEISCDPAYSKFLNAGKTAYLPTNPSHIPAKISDDDSHLLTCILVAEFNQVYSVMQQLNQNFIKKQPQLNLAVNFIQNFVANHMQGYYAEVDYTRHFGNGGHFSWTAQTSYSVENDTKLHNANFQRQVSKTIASVDWLSPFWNQNYKSTSPIELKFALEYDWVTSKDVYTKDKRTSLSPSLSLNINVTDKIAIPLTIKYDDQKSNLFGFLSVQYNLGAGK